MRKEGSSLPSWRDWPFVTKLALLLLALAVLPLASITLDNNTRINELLPQAGQPPRYASPGEDVHE